MIYAGILAGGTGSRMGITDMPKQFLDLGGRPILIHTVEKFLLVHEIQKIVLGIHPDWVTYTEDLVDKYLASYKDSVRPFVSLKTIQENIELAKSHDVVDTVVEATDTIVQSLDNTFITEIPERQYLYQGQTPQTFKMKDFLALYHDLSDQQKEVLTDACKIFVINGKKVALAKGEYSNIKITTITDLKIARGMIEDN